MDAFGEARARIVERIRAELIGPGSEPCGPDSEREIITDRPTQRYTTGMLFPQNEVWEPGEEENDDSGSREAAADTETEASDYYLDRHISLANQFYPSAMGLTFYTDNTPVALEVCVSGAWYRRCNWDECAVNLEEVPGSVLQHTGAIAFVVHANGILKPTRRFGWDEVGRVQKRAGELLATLPEEDVGPLREVGFLRKNDRPEVILGRYYAEWSKLQSAAVSGTTKKQLHTIWRIVWSVRKLCRQIEYGWVREPVNAVVSISDRDGERFETDICDGLALTCFRRRDETRGRTRYTVSLINTHVSAGRAADDEVFCQAKLSVRASDGSAVFCDLPDPETVVQDDERASLALLYRDRRRFAVGHGCSVTWAEAGGGPAFRVATTFLPDCEVAAQLDYKVPRLADRTQVLEMKELSTLSSRPVADTLADLDVFCDAYRDWIAEQQDHIDSLPEKHKVVAEQHLEACDEALSRMCNGVQLLRQDSTILRAFRLANTAMLMQRLHSDLQEVKRLPGESELAWPDYRNPPEGRARWRPFQLAFFLMCLESVADPDSSERDIADLIWFPTGGGKTEAYLGLTAFSIFIRRMRYPGRPQGTSVIMRYTLRLLTTQQFQRASTLICACELLRRQEPDLGDEPISIGLWIGGKSTPNKTVEALSELRRLEAGVSTKNRFQLLSCPWCGTHMERQGGRGMWGYREGSRPRHLILFCPERNCPFNDELPVRVVDEDIYRNPTTLLFGTVDKFALMAWEEDVSSLFGLDSADRLKPDLIIQDELHLISGPLGTIVGLYETAIDAFCRANGNKPKVIASTATTRRAAEQCAALYDRRLRQFPPPGLDARDSYFAREPDPAEQEGRLYIGLMSSCKTQTTTEIRLCATVLQAVYELECPDEVRDSFWTLVGYFNSLRELGQAVTLVNDDIKDYMRRVAMRNGVEPRPIYEPDELTSRIDSALIPDKLRKLGIHYPDPAAIDVLLASNMISVGVDISRLGLMIVVGQPKTTAEYIQATSRIGRQQAGLVVTVYDGARSRDRSHFERFVDYHGSFYRYVEPSSVTPFSSRARERVLHAVFAALVRHIGGLRNNRAASHVHELTEEELERLKAVVLERAQRTAGRGAWVPSEGEFEAIEEELDQFIACWRRLAAGPEGDKLTYRDWRDSGRPVLLYPAGKNADVGGRETLLSMRNVDTPCRIHIREE